MLQDGAHGKAFGILTWNGTVQPTHCLCTRVRCACVVFNSLPILLWHAQEK